VKAAIAYLQQYQQQHLDELAALCRIPSISTQDEHGPDMRQAAEFTCELCARIGLQAEIHETGGHPLVYAEWCQAPGAPTYLAYGHIDVQPEGDLSLWDAAPFEPVVEDGWLICRGAADNKGPLLVYLRAAEAWLKTAGKLPVNLKLLIEAEEEIGSPSLAPFVARNRTLLQCDGILISDTTIFEDGWPTITTGTRGICYKEIRLSGPKQDVHSGDGGPIANPANALAALVASLHDRHGRVNIPGFYDDVADPPAEERTQLAALPFDEQKYAAELGVPGFRGEAGWSVPELRLLRPTLDVNGIYGGYMKAGSNTIIPATAGVKLSMRLVPDQVAENISRKFDAAVRARCPDTVRCEIISHAHAQPYLTPHDSPALLAAKRALREAFGREAACVRCGGSLPILSMFRQELSADSLLLGLASPRCNAHGPNEKVNLADLSRGAEALVRLLAYLQ
jgi:acetylornithine deacetylase/succinyl-diaminopimelate desuccinylase-like protein